MTRHLSLTRERLCELTPDELGSFAAGAGLQETTLCNPPTLNAMCERLIAVTKTAVETITCWC